MKKFRFSLEKVLRYKRLLKEQKEAALAKAHKEYLAHKREMDRLDSLLEEGKKRMLKGRLSTAMMVHRTAYVESVAKCLSAQIRVTQAAREKVTECRKLLVQAEKEYRILEKLKEHQYEDYRQYVEKEVQKELDEVAASAFARRG